MNRIKQQTENLKKRQREINLLLKKRMKNFTETPKIEKPQELTLVNSMLQIYIKAKKSELDDDFFKKIERYTNFVNEKLSVSPMQAVLLSVFMEDTWDEQSLASFFGTFNLHLYLYTNDINILIQQKFIKQKKSYRTDITEYQISNEAKKAIIANKSFVPNDYANSTIEQFFDTLQELFKDFDEFDFNTVNQEINLLVNNNPQLHFVQQLQKYKLTDEERLLFLMCCDKYISEGERYNSVCLFRGNSRINLLITNLKSSALKKEKLIRKKKNILRSSYFGLSKLAKKQFFQVPQS